MTVRPQLPAPIRIDRIHGGNIGHRILDFSVSVNPLGAPPEAIAAYHAAVARIGNYPAPYASRIENKLADSLHIDSKCVLASNGTTQLIYLLARLLSPQAPGVVIPTFSEIANALIAVSSTPRGIPLNPDRDFEIEADAIRRAFENGADAVFVGRPNSPTGTTLSYEDAIAIAHEASERGVWCVFDEAFLDFARDDRSLAKIAAHDSRIIVLRSLTKIFAIPGLRLGYIVAHHNTVQRLREGLEPWSVNVVAEEVGIACMEVAPEFVGRTRSFVAEERTRLCAELAPNPRLQVIPSVTNFQMIKITNEAAPGDFVRHLMASGIAIRNLSELPGAGPGFYRVGLRNRNANTLLIDAIATWR